MLGLLVSLCALVQPQEPVVSPALDIVSMEGGEHHLTVIQRGDRLEPPKTSPKGKLAFDWIVAAYGDSPVPGQQKLRFRVFSQERRSENDKAMPVARMLVHLWDFNSKRLKLDHGFVYNDQIVDVYLCFGGKAGGEQLFDEDTEGGRARKVNTIYIYQLGSFTQPVEMAREIAHEYGHATLPPVGPFTQPEDWANGNLGERLYLRWLREEIKAGRLTPKDAMGATLPELDGYLKANVDPLVCKVALEGPDTALLERPGSDSMQAYLGVALYAETILPRKAFARSLVLSASSKASDYPKAIVEAAEEQSDWIVNMPPAFANQKTWIPIGKGKISGAAIFQRKGSWAQIKAGTNPVIVHNAVDRLG